MGRSSLEKTNGFIYEYTFTTGYNYPVKVTIDREFESVAELESISRFPHAQRRAFARLILERYDAGSFHTLNDTDIVNPFARKLARLFSSQLQVYWTARPSDIALIITGFLISKFAHFSKSYPDNLCHCVQIQSLFCWNVVFGKFRRQETSIKSFLEVDADKEDGD